jgi:hypothetical protein
MVRHLKTLVLPILVLLPLVGLADDQEKSPEEQQQAWAEYMQLMQPGEAHQHLDVMAGEWTMTTRTWMGGPGTEPMVSKGTSRKTWILGGRYLEEKSSGTMMGQPYEGLGLLGHDNVKNLYSLVWCDNMGTQYWTARGGRHPETGRISMFGEMDEPMLDVYGRMVQAVYEIEGPDRHVFRIVDLHAGDDYLVFEVVYDRVK